MESTGQNQEPWFLKSNFPVYIPSHPALTLTREEFEAFLSTELGNRHHEHSGHGESQATLEHAPTEADTDTLTIVSGPSTTGELREGLEKLAVDAEENTAKSATSPELKQEHPFMQGLLSHGKSSEPSAEDMENKMLTENAGLAHRSTTDALVDLFAELEDVVSGPRLLELLNAAWACDSLTTLKIIFNSRSIHLGKSSRQTFYRCAGWLAKYHPLTLVANLQWLSRPVIQKKADKKDESKGEDEDIVLVDSEVDENDPARFDVRNGVAHGYWKDLLNLLALQVNGKLDVLAHPRDILNVEQEKGKKWPDSDTAKELRHQKRDGRHEAAVEAFNNEPVYRALHLAVARLFATELKSDLARLHGQDAKAKRGISLCAKWAPSHERFHDKHTFIVSTIAELMHPASEFSTALGAYDGSNKEQREWYLRHARDAYRKDVASLRKHLEVVEREITANTFENIKYERVPSAAMNNYSPLFAKKDTARFDKYLDNVASGKAQISGATLLPSTLIKTVRQSGPNPDSTAYLTASMGSKRKGTSEVVDRKIQHMHAKVADGQWKSLVQRIKDSGTLQSSIAVADVSGSMAGPTFPDGTCPMDSSIGLALLLAEVTEPPFGGAFITFSHNPEVQRVDPSKSLHEKYRQLSRAAWSMNTDFVAVFEKLILPMAVKNKLKQEDMVKRVFVFSDMQFDAAEYGDEWSTSYESIKRKFERAGYEMPQLVFWNLAGGRAGYGGGYGRGDPVAPKPVTAADEGTAIVSGYSQGMLKVFLENGTFEDDDEEKEVVTKETSDDGEVVVEKQVKKQKMDPLSTVKKAISHKAYDMLRVVD